MHSNSISKPIRNNLAKKLSEFSNKLAKNVSILILIKMMALI